MVVDHVIEVTFQPTKHDSFRGGMLVFRERFKWIYRIALAISVLLVIPVLLMNIFADPSDRPSLYPLDQVIVLPFAVYFFPSAILGATVRAMFRGNSHASDQVTYAFTQAGIEITSFARNASLQWQLYVRARETEEYFLLYPTPGSAVVIPKRCFLSDQDVRDLRDLLRASISGSVEVLT
jgi:YcxB-like protein